MGNWLSVNNTTYMSEKPWPRDGAQRWSTFELYPSWSGERHNVYEGLSYAKDDTYTETKREVVVKTKSHLPIDWTSYLDCHKEATTLATRFNRYAAHLSGDKIRFADSVISPICDVSDIMKITKLLGLITMNLHEDDNVLVEEYLKGNFLHFLSKWGEVRHSKCELLEAFAHFTHHESHGQLVVCNLKGIFNNGCFSLTNPTIHSSTGQFGSKDYRTAGISEVYRNHCCNFICNGLGLPRKNNEEKN
ncbi:hypothetical protein ACJMK2_035399 [Sinanodonta woodiana]|uniref:Alpha-type protein kinase domain-containing protein n=1 Tax=Sinanodonta woodiana TaxID=1069815 RepID=A0ABD3WWK8_SINWO